MPDYSKSKIYTVRCRSDDKLIYVGSTIQPLHVRLAGHKRDTTISLYKYIDNPENNTKWDDWYIELFESFPCNTKEELTKREGEVIREIATINKRGYYINDKEYREANSEKFKQKYKEWYAMNREENNLKRREAAASNREEYNRKQREYNAANREKLNQKMNEYNAANREKINKKANDYLAANRDRINARRRELRALKKEQAQ